MQKYSRDDWARLGRAVKRARRSQQHLVLADWAGIVGVSSKTLGQLEQGRAVSEDTLYRVEAALTWAEGDTTRILEGESTGDDGYVSAPGEHAPSEVTNAEVLQAIHEMRQRVDDLADKVDKMTGGQP